MKTKSASQKSDHSSIYQDSNKDFEIVGSKVKMSKPSNIYVNAENMLVPQKKGSAQYDLKQSKISAEFSKRTKMSGERASTALNSMLVDDSIERSGLNTSAQTIQVNQIGSRQLMKGQESQDYAI